MTPTLYLRLFESVHIFAQPVEDRDNDISMSSDNTVSF